MAWAVWFTGLPGSGKSSIVDRLIEQIGDEGVQVLRMDEFRKILTPDPQYTDEEREMAYRAMVLVGKFLAQNGVNVIFDATAHKRQFRHLARQLMKNFREVYVKCSLETAMKREAGRKDNVVISDMYQKALDRKGGKQVEGLGEVIGIDVPYEEPENPDLTVDAENKSPEENAKYILEELSWIG